MTRTLVAILIAALLATGAGYWAGSRQHTPAASTAAPAGEPAKKERKLLYYRNPMGLPDTSPVPKKDSMGMDYIAVYEGEDEPANPSQLKFSPEKIQKLGVRSEAAALRDFGQTVRASGRIEVDETRIVTVAPKFEGFVERLAVSATGQPVAKGQVLFEAYSPDLVSAQHEYAIAAQGARTLREAGGDAASLQQLADAGLARLKNWDIGDEQLKALARSGEARRTLALRAPVSGIVSEKKAVQGMRFMPGEALYQIADLSSVWVLADVFEQDLAQIRPGAPVSVRVNAWPDKTFTGKVAYLYPTLKADTRTQTVRIELPNPGGLLKPGLYAQVELGGKAGQALAVPPGAVIDSGVRRIVFIDLGEGRFEPREVETGTRSTDWIEIRKGVVAGDKVVVAANFLIDAESNLKAALGGFNPAPAQVGHSAEGKVESVDAKAGTVSITHGPVASLKWPAMTMDFVPANPALLAQLKAGAAIHFEFVERGHGEWVITRVETPAGR